MKAARIIARVMRIVGWAVVGIAVAVTIYALATGGGPYGTIKGTMETYGKSMGFSERVQFNHQYFDALVDAANTKGQQESLRMDSARKYFTRWFGQLSEGLAEFSDQGVANYYAENPFDTGAFRTFCEQLESGEDSRELKEAFEYLDQVAKPGGKSGKLAKLQAASVAPDFEKYYQEFSASKGGEVSYLEYVETIADMIRADIAGGTAVTDVRKYAQSLDMTKFNAALEILRQKEREAVYDVREALLEALNTKGDKPETVQSFMHELYGTLSERYGTANLPEEATFVNTAVPYLWDESFDGSLNALNAKVRAAYESSGIYGLEVRKDTFVRGVITTSDQNNDLGAFRVLWFLAANIIWVWVVGIALIVLAAVLDKIVSKVTLKHLEHAGIKEDDDVLLRVNHLKQYFRSGNFINKAVDDVSFYIKKGEVFGLVGESGCGKTTTGRTIINLYDPTEGDVYFQGLRISSTQNGLPVLLRSLRNDFEAEKKRLQAECKAGTLSQSEYDSRVSAMHKELKERIRTAKTNALESSVEKSKCVEKYREKRKEELTAEFNKDMQHLSGQAAEDRKARYEMDMKVASKDNIMTKMQMIFQDPIASINPRMTVREIIAEGLKIRGIKDEKYIDEKVYEVLDLVGLVREHAGRYPHEFSGGQRQRIGIARAIVLQPDLIIADEPISALDVSIQAQVINLLNDLRDKMGLTIMFIAHNLSVVKYFSDRIGVMYYGHLVELTTSDELFEHPLHPYTKSLLSAIPYPDPHYEKQRKRIEYDPHKAHDYSVDKPSLREIRPGHFIRCNNAEFEAYKKELGI